jgi:hypothetical protein
MTKPLSRHLGAGVAVVSLWPLSSLAGGLDPAANLLACRQGWPSLERSRLTLSALAATERLRNYTACRKGRGYCDRPRLTPAEAAAIPAEPGVASSVGRQP